LHPHGESRLNERQGDALGNVPGKRTVRQNVPWIGGEHRPLSHRMDAGFRMTVIGRAGGIAGLTGTDDDAALAKRARRA